MQAQHHMNVGQAKGGRPFVHAVPSGRSLLRQPPRIAQQAERPTETSKLKISEAQKQAFQRDGFVYIPGVLSEEEMQQHVDPVYFKFLNGDIKVPGKDKCDMAGKASSTDPEDYVLYNVMAPREHYPQWQGNLLEQRCEEISRQLLNSDVEVDFDQILAKRPQTRDSGMPWHQDAAAWPELGPDCSTAANCWVAVSDVPVESGCMRYVPGSHREQNLRPHQPVNDQIQRTSVGGERAELVPMQRGDVVVHCERVVHGSGPNMSPNWRYGYVLNFKRSDCVVDDKWDGKTHQ